MFTVDGLLFTVILNGVKDLPCIFGGKMTKKVRNSDAKIALSRLKESKDKVVSAKVMWKQVEKKAR